MPKGLEDWRIVFDAGANKLNDVVWVPSFFLPTVNSLLRIVDDKSMMSDCNMGEMFHQFQLHEDTVLESGVDLGPLQLSTVECSQRYMVWRRSLMGFRPLPYNCIRMYLVAKEVIRGDWHNQNNAFQWDSLMLNLPGTCDYKQGLAWITKRRADNSLASDFVCFVDNQQVTGMGSKRVREAGHAISTSKAYLGLQDALRKVQHNDGTTTPGAWAGVNVCVERNKGIVVMISQDT